MLLLPLFLCLTLTTVQSAFTSITTAADLAAFANEVSSGTSPYRGSTVTLDADIDLSKVDFPGIGKTGGNNYCFRGVFEGKGHVISGMNLASSDSKYLGFFNCLNGGSVKDLVIDSSCSVTNSFDQTSSSDPNQAAGIAAYVLSGLSNTKMEILNCVNMAAVTGAGTHSRVGGIAGYVYALSSPVVVMNCANMGDIIHPETTEKTATIGGIVGWLTSANSQNFSSVINCVNMGYIRTGAPNSGGIVGDSTSSYNKIENNYWLEGTSERGTSGTITSTTSKNFNSSYVLSSGEPLIDKLNSYASSQSGLLKWSTATFNTNGGTPVCSMVIMRTILGEPGTPTRTGYTFVGWYTDAALKTKWTPSTVFGGDATLHAKWIVNQYTVFFNTNLGSPIGPRTSEYLNTIQLDTPTRTGHTFTSWIDDKGNTFTESYTINRAENVTLTAQWTPNNYVISFEVNGGDSLSELERTKGVTYDQQYGDLPEPTRTGHSFNGWLTEDGGESVTSETIVTTPNDHTLTAQWTPNKYTIFFATGCGTTIPSVTRDFGITITLDTTLTKTGYTFASWTDDKGNTFQGSYTMSRAENVTLYAKWKINLYTVIFNTNGGSPLEPITSEYSSTIPLPAPTRTGYTFTFWTDDKGNTFQRSYTMSRAENVTLTAQWTINNYTLTFDFDNGTVDEKVVDFNETIDYPENPIKLGYTFDGWDINPAFMPAEDTTIKAMWTPNNYTLTFNTNGGSSIGPITGDYLSTISLPTPTRTGYTFASWNDENENTFKFNYTINRAENVTLTAQWTINNYTLTFDLGNILEEKILDFNETIEYPENFTRVGYEFLGWNNSITEMPANDLTIKALWNLTASEFVEIVFDRKGMTESQIRELIVKFTQDDSYEIARFESDRDGTTVVLRFKDVNEAISFVDAIEKSSGSGIRGVGFSNEPFSFSTSLLPSAYLFFMSFVAFTFLF